MPPDEPEDDSHKIAIEFDYGHFIRIHGWLYEAQLVRDISFNKNFLCGYRKIETDN